MKVCVIVPTYNERENIAAFVGALYGVLGQDATVCVVDDNSPDGTQSIVESLMPMFPTLMLLKRAKKEGLGRAYVHAFKELRDKFDVLVITDADFSEHPLYIPQLIHGLQNSDVVAGSRYVQGGRIAGWGMYRRVLSLGGNMYVRLLTGIPLYDVSLGFAAIKTSALKKVDLDSLRAMGYAFIMELKHALIQSGSHIQEVPITFVDRIGGTSKISMKIVKEGFIAPWYVQRIHG